MSGLREQLDDARFALRAWSQGIAWLTVLGGVGTALTAWSRHDDALFAAGVTAVVVAFVPRARPEWVYRVAQTVAIRRGWAAVPAEERPLRTPDEILSRRSPPTPEKGRPN